MAGQEKARTVKEILAGATPEQVRWVLARLTAKTDQAAARAAEVHPSTVSRWPNKPDLDEAVFLLLMAPAQGAVEVLEGAAIRAAEVLVDELGDKRNRRLAADSILDRVGAKAPTRHELTGADGAPIVIRWAEELGD